jgi:sugar/nucleoside kinase (ribokinase family)
VTQSRFATLGNITIDDLIFADGTTMWAVPGGNAIYSALGIAIWGETPSVVAPIGPQYPVQLLAGRVDMSRCRVQEHTLRDWGLYEEDGSRQFLFRSHTKDWLLYSPTLEDADGLDCAYAHLAPMPWKLQIELAERLRAQGTKVIGVDLDDRYLAEMSRDDVLRMLNAVDLFLPSKQDAEALFPRMASLDALRTLRAMAPNTPLIAVKQGANGVIAHSVGEADYFVVPSAAELVVDTTGAGDAFSGGALAGYAATGGALGAILRGSVAGSFAVASSGPGALVEAPLEEAHRRLERLAGRVDTHPL